MKTYSRQIQYQDRKRESGMCPQCGRPRLYNTQLCGKCSAKLKVRYWTEAALKKYPHLRYKDCDSCQQKD